MKIVKKIGIGFIALIICFCSCFRFANAETLTANSVLNPNVQYYLYVDFNVYGIGDGAVEVYDTSNNIGMLVIEDNFINDTHDYYLYIEFSSYEVEIDLDFVGTYQQYDVFSFVPNDFYIISTYEYPIDILYIDTDSFNSFSVYDTIYDLVEKYIFGGNIEKGSHQDLTATTLSSIICVLVFALPFLVIWKVIKVIMG